MCRRRLRFEAMEKRQLLAGDLLLPSEISAPGEVRVVVTGGNMVVTGDIANGVSLNESIQILQVPDTSNFSVTGLNGTKVNGGAANGTVTFPGVTGSITIDLKGGNNVVKFGETSQQTVNRALTIRSGAGADTIEITNTKVNGILTIDAGAGTNNVTLKGIDATGNVSIKGTIGNDTVTIEDDPGTTRKFNGTLSVDGGAGDNTVTLKNLTVVRNLSVIGTTGEDTVNITGTNVSNGTLSVSIGAGVGNVTLDNVNIARGISVVGTTNKDTVNITGATITNGSLSVSTGAGEGNVTLNNVNIPRGSLSVIGTTDKDTVNITGANVPNGAVSVNGGAGTNDVTLNNVTSVRSVSVLGTTGQDTVTITGVTLTNTTGSLAVSTGAGEGTVTLSNVTIPRGNLSVIGTTDKDTVNLTGVTLTNGTLSINTGAGEGTVTLSNVTITRGNLSVIGTTGKDTVNLTNTKTSSGTLTIDGGAGINTMNLLGVTATGNASIKGTTGVDTVTIEPLKDGAEVVAESKFSGTLMIDLGTVASNRVTIGSVGPTVVTRDMTIKSPTASEKVSVKNVNVTEGRLSIEAGNVGEKAIELEGLDIKRDLVVVALYPIDTVTETMSLKQSKVGGSLSVNARSGRINVLIEDNNQLKDLTLTAGVFRNLTISSNLTSPNITGNVTIRSTSTTGSDNVNITGSQIKGRLSVDLGSGANDTFTMTKGGVDLDATIKTMATSIGTIDIRGDQDSRVVFKGKLTITTGNGNETIKLMDGNVTGATSVITGSGADSIGLKDFHIDSDLVINAGLNPEPLKGNATMKEQKERFDRIAIVGGKATNVTVDGGNPDQTALGIAQVLITGLTVNANLTVKGGSAPDYIGIGDAKEIAKLTGDVEGLDVVSELKDQLGNDVEDHFGEVTIKGTTSISTSYFGDHVWLHTVNTKSLIIDTSFGDDKVKIYKLNGSVSGSASAGSRINVNLSNGDDVLTLSEVEQSEFLSTLIDGGVDGVKTLPAVPGDRLISTPQIAANDAVFKNWEFFGQSG